MVDWWLVIGALERWAVGGYNVHVHLIHLFPTPANKPTHTNPHTNTHTKMTTHVLVRGLLPLALRLFGPPATTTNRAQARR